MAFRLRRHWRRILLIIALAVVGLPAGTLALLQIPAVATWAIRRLVPLVPLEAGYELEVGRVSGSIVGGVQLEDVRLRRAGRELARVDRLRVGYDIRRLRGRNIRLREVIVDGAHAAARRERDGWDLANALRQSGDSAAGGSFAVDRLELREVDLAAQLSPDSVVRVRNLVVRARDLIVGEQVLVTLDTLTAAVSPPSSPPLWLELATRGRVTAEELRFDPLRIRTRRSGIAGRVVLPRRLTDARSADRLDVRLKAAPLALADLAAIFPGVAAAGDLQLEFTASSEGRLATGHLTAGLDSAGVTLDGSTMLGEGPPALYRMDAVLRDVDPARIYAGLPRARLNGKLEADLKGPSLSLAGGRMALQLAASSIGGTEVPKLELRAEVNSGRADFALRGGIGGGTVRADGWARPFDSMPSYRLTGAARRLSGTDALGNRFFDLRFRLAGRGATPDAARATGRVELAALQDGSEPVPLGHAAFSFAESRLELRPELLVAGGRMTGLAVVTLGDTIAYEVRRGSIHNVDLGRLLEDTVAAPVSGRFTLSGRGTSPEEAIATARLELEELRYGARHLDGVVARARLRGGRATLDLRGALQGGRLALDAAGRPFDSVPNFILRSGSLEHVDLGTLLARPDLAGPVTLRASGSGRWSEQARTLRGQLTFEPSRLGRIDVTGGTLSARMSGQRLTYDGSLHTTGGALVFEGDGRPLSESPSFSITRGEIDSINLGVLLGRSDLATGLNGRFTASASGAAADSLIGQLDLELFPSRINDAELRSGRLALAMDRGVLRGQVRLEAEDGELAAELAGRATGEYPELGANGTLRLERLARWTGRPNTDGRLDTRFVLQGSADSAGLLTLGGTIGAAGTVGAMRVDTLHLALSPEPGAIRVDTALFRSNVIALDGAGRVALRGQGTGDTLRITGETVDLAPIAELTGLYSLSLDSSRVALTIMGPAWGWGLRGRAEIHRLLYAGSQAERILLRGTGTLDSTRLAALAGRLRIEGGAMGGVTLTEAEMSGRYDSLVAVEGMATIDDTVRVALALRGAADPDTVRTRLERLEVAEGGRTWSLERPAGLMLRPRIEVERLALRSNERVITVDGVFDRRDSSDLAVRFQDVELGALRDAGLVPIGGRLDGRLRLTGPAASPRVEGRIGLAVRPGNGRELGRIQSDLEWTRAGLRIDAVAAPRSGRRLSVSGTLPWGLSLAPSDTAAQMEMVRRPADTLGLTLRADSFDLAFFDPILPRETIRDLEGALVLDARVGGTPDAPRVEGIARLTGAELTLPALGVSYRRGELLARLAGDRIEVRRLRLFTGDEEELSAQGLVQLRSLANPALDLTAELREFRISHSSELRSVASGSLRVGGTVENPALTGDLRLGRTDLFIGSEGASSEVEEVELTPADLRQLARHFGPAALARADEGPSLVERFRLDLDVRLPGQVWFRRRSTPKIDIELTGRMRVRQQPGEEMQFFGRVRPMPGRGFLEIYGRSFRLTGGEITLAGPAATTHLDVTAEYQVPTQSGPDNAPVLVNVAAVGRPDSLALEFTAEPTMGQDDIVSYIITGRPASDNPLAEEAGGQGAELAFNQLSESLSGAAGEALGLDVFQIRQDGLRGLTLTAGRYVASRLFLSLEQPIQLGGGADQAGGGKLGPGFELEYTANRWLRANLRGGNVPPRFFLRGRYAY
ncbi:MAG: translocation/assembly module TamB [Gemmatimonadota bacterium]|nr:translocation/assembly module TamB [Gemmatimonadota bacterium]